jgi:hypothetical protein
MMQTLILTFVVFLLAVLAMALGVMVTGRSLKGSCGGPSCKCVADGDDVLACAEERENGASLPMHSSR